MRNARAGVLVVVAAVLALPAAAHGSARSVDADPPLLAPIAPATAPDGSVWFTEQGADRLGRIAPDGTLTEVAAPKRLSLSAGSLHIDGFTADGRVIVVRDYEQKTQLYDPATRTTQLVDFGLATGEVTTTPDGALWAAGDLRAPSDASGVVRVAPDLSATTPVQTGHDQSVFAIAPYGTSGSVVAILGGPVSVEAVRVNPDGSTAPITLPAGARPSAYISAVSGPAGTFLALDDRLLRVGDDLVARVVSGAKVADAPRSVALGGDGSTWLTGDAIVDPVVRFAPDFSRSDFAPLSRTKDPGVLGSAGIAVDPAGRAWVAVSSIGAGTRERLVRYAPDGGVADLLLGTPPRATVSVLSGTSASAEAEKLARAKRRTLAVRVRCSAACTVTTAVRDGYGSRTNHVYARRTVHLTKAGSKRVTLTATRRASSKADKGSFQLLPTLSDSSHYLKKSVAQRGGGTLVPR